MKQNTRGVRIIPKGIEKYRKLVSILNEKKWEYRTYQLPDEQGFHHIYATRLTRREEGKYLTLRQLHISAFEWRLSCRKPTAGSAATVKNMVTHRTGATSPQFATQPHLSGLHRGQEYPSKMWQLPGQCRSGHAEGHGSVRRVHEKSSTGTESPISEQRFPAP